MTVVSTVMAFLFMPLNIFIYTRLWIDELSGMAISKSPYGVIPYDKILIALASALGPAILGIIIRKLSVKVANILAKVRLLPYFHFCFIVAVYSFVFL